MSGNGEDDPTLSRGELVARIRHVLVRGKEHRESYRSQNERFGLTAEQSKFIRGIGNAGVSDDVLHTAYRKILDSGATEPLLPPKRSLYGFDCYNAPPRRSPAYIAAHCGVFLGVGVSTLSQGMFYITINEVTPSENGIRFVQKAFDKWEKADEPQHLSEGHGYFVGNQIYIFIESTHAADGITSIIVNQPDMPPARRLFGVYAGRGSTDAQPSHPAAAQVVFLLLHDVRPGSYADMKLANARLASADSTVRERWINEEALRALGLGDDVTSHLIRNNGVGVDDFALRTASAFGKRPNVGL